MKPRVALFGSRPLAERVLRELHRRAEVEIMGVVTLPRGTKGWWGSDLAGVADELGVPVVDEAAILAKPVDLCLSVNHTQLIHEPLLSHPPRGFLNVHHSHNLRFRGRNCGAWAILEARASGIWEHGTTLHFMTEKLDVGPIVATAGFPFGEDATGKELYDRADDLAFELLMASLPSVLAGTAKTTAPHPQPLYRDSKSLDGRRADVCWPEDRLWDFVRALTFPPHPPPFLEIHGRKVHLVPVRDRPSR